MNRMPLGHIRQNPILIRPPIHNLHLRKLYPLLIPRRRRNSRHHHQLHQLLTFPRQFASLGLFQAVLGRGDVFVRKGLEEDLQLVLPEFLLAGLVQEGEVADMMDEDVAQDGEFGVNGGDFAVFGFEGGAEAVQGGWGVEFGDFGADLVGDEFAFEVCQVTVSKLS